MGAGSLPGIRPLCLRMLQGLLLVRGGAACSTCCTEAVPCCVAIAWLCGWPGLAAVAVLGELGNCCKMVSVVGWMEFVLVISGYAAS